MSSKRTFGVVGLAAALLIGYVIWERYLSSEAQVRRALAGVAVAAEGADAEALVSFLSSDYSDFVHSDRASLQAMLHVSFSKVDRLNVTLRSVDVAVDGVEAVARFDAVVVAIRGEERYVVLGTPFEGEKLEAALQHQPDGWKIRRVSRSALAP